jgi:proteasome alpha subunit
MIDEPYRWLEAIANRREYIQDQLKGGSPIILVGYDNGLLLATIGREHQKLFEVYDRVAFSAIGHPADIEKLRMIGIDMAHVEGFTRATQDVAVRRVVNFGVAPTVKAAFEQIFAAPYIARMMFAELGDTEDEDLVCKIDYDGSFKVKSGGDERVLCDVVAGTPQLESAMIEWLREKVGDHRQTRDEALELALEAWIVAKHTTLEGEADKVEVRLPQNFDARKALREEVKTGTIEAAVLDRSRPEDNKFARLSEKEFKDVLK